MGERGEGVKERREQLINTNKEEEKKTQYITNINYASMWTGLRRTKSPVLIVLHILEAHIKRECPVAVLIWSHI